MDFWMRARARSFRLRLASVLIIYNYNFHYWKLLSISLISYAYSYRYPNVNKRCMAWHVWRRCVLWQFVLDVIHSIPFEIRTSFAFWLLVCNCKRAIRMNEIGLNQEEHKTFRVRQQTAYGRTVTSCISQSQLARQLICMTVMALN